MATLKYTISITSPKEKVWDILWNDSSYRKWTSVFMEGSYAKSDWNEGSKISFLSPENNGMFSIIESKKPPVEMMFRHLGEIKNGVEEPKNWQDTTESYRLEESDGITKLDVTLTMEPNQEFESYFNETFPKALAVVKQMAEE